MDDLSNINTLLENMTEGLAELREDLFQKYAKKRRDRRSYKEHSLHHNEQNRNKNDLNNRN